MFVLVDINHDITAINGFYQYFFSRAEKELYATVKFHDLAITQILLNNK